MTSNYVYHSDLWMEEPEDSNPFAAKRCYCSGYDVYGQILPNGSWFEYLLLLFHGERPTREAARLMEKLAMVLANPGPREASVRAAMNAGVAGTNHSSALMAALAVGAGQYGGAQEVAISVRLWRECGHDILRWKERLFHPDDDERADIWTPIEHAPGFDPNGENTPTPVCQALDYLVGLAPADGALAWLQAHRQELESAVGYPLALSGVAAAAFVDLNLDDDQASMLYLILRLPGAAAHALEQKRMGWKKFPFYGPAIELADDPGPVSSGSGQEGESA